MTEIFESLAATYDDSFTHTAVGRMQRGRVYRWLAPLLDREKKVLELNCGTGEDAAWLSDKVNSVLATDQSPAMLKIAEKKWRERGISNVHARVLDLRSPQIFPTEQFDLVFSNFGGMNCLTFSELKSLAVFLDKRLKPGGRMLIVMLAQKCVWENFYFLVKGDVRYRRRESTTGVDTDLGSGQFKTYYYSPAVFCRAFDPFFKCVKVAPVGLFIPPSFLNGLIQKSRFFRTTIAVLERVFANAARLANYADHYTVILEKPSKRRPGTT